MFELNEYVKNALSFALDSAEQIAKSTDNKIDDIIVMSASNILRQVFGIKKED